MKVSDWPAYSEAASQEEAAPALLSAPGFHAAGWYPNEDQPLLAGLEEGAVVI